jgi:hypothetical protein
LAALESQSSKVSAAVTAAAANAAPASTTAVAPKVDLAPVIAAVEAVQAKVSVCNYYQHPTAAIEYGYVHVIINISYDMIGISNCR